MNRFLAMGLIIGGISLAGVSTLQAQNAIFIDAIQGFMPPNQLAVGEPITFSFWYKVNFPTEADGWASFSNGFDLYSPEGATWNITTQSFVTTTPATLALHSDWGTGDFFIYTFDLNGNGHDTVAFAGFDGTIPFAISYSFDSKMALIATTGFDTSEAGKTFCIDSCTNFPFVNTWAFAGGSQTIEPTFGTGLYAANYTPGMGYCFLLAERPYICGDVNNDSHVTIADITYLVRYLFNGGITIPNPLARANANCSANPGPTVADITYLINFLFGSFPPPCTNCNH